MIAMPSLLRCSLIRLRARVAPSSSSDASGSSRIQSLAREASRRDSARRRRCPAESRRAGKCCCLLSPTRSRTACASSLAQRVPGNAAGNAQVLNRIQLVLHPILVGDVSDLRRNTLRRGGGCLFLPSELRRRPAPSARRQFSAGWSCRFRLVQTPAESFRRAEKS